MWRSLVMFILLLVILGAMIGFASSMQVSGGVIQVFEYTVSIPTLTPTLTFTPEPVDEPLPGPEGWDRSSLEFIDQGSNCAAGGAVWATVKNVGEAMAGESSWALYENVNLLESESLPALAAGGAYTISVNVSQSGIYRFKAYQRPGKPGKAVFWSEEIVFDSQRCNERQAAFVDTPTSAPILLPPATPTPSQTALPTKTNSPTPAPSSKDCVKTLNFWIAHPGDWPLENLTIGGEIYASPQILDILEIQSENDVAIFLAQQLIVAEINLQNGVPGSSIEKTVREADGWLRSHPLGSDLAYLESAEGYALAVHLADFNSGLAGPQLCEDQIVPDYPPAPEVPPTLTPSQAPTETPVEPPLDTPPPTLTLEITFTPTITSTHTVAPTHTNTPPSTPVPTSPPTSAPTQTSSPTITPTLASPQDPGTTPSATSPP